MSSMFIKLLVYYSKHPWKTLEAFVKNAIFMNCNHQASARRHGSIDNPENWPTLHLLQSGLGPRGALWSTPSSCSGRNPYPSVWWEHTFKGLMMTLMIPTKLWYCVGETTQVRFKRPFIWAQWDSYSAYFCCQITCLRHTYVSQRKH